ncbi:MAG: DUF2752 domain-containing protein [Planctomycetes bacterium]|nr:DUF2752 domain-containing protein [Planctomycetota bacterium]
MSSTLDQQPVPEARPAAKSTHPLGPACYRLAAANPTRTRGGALLVVVGCLAVLGLARTLAPDARGLGTHRGLGLPECGLVRAVGYPCPTCGMTTAFALTVRGHWLAAFRAQPAGLLVCLATLVALGLAVSTLITGTCWRINWYRVSPTRVVLVAAGLLLTGWAYKIVSGLWDGSLPLGP